MSTLLPSFLGIIQPISSLEISSFKEGSVLEMAGQFEEKPLYWNLPIAMSLLWVRISM